jgi:FXSXX-COOH protein
MNKDSSGEQHLDLIDLRGMGLAELDRLPDTVLAAALRRVLGVSDGVGDRYCGFESSLP